MLVIIYTEMRGYWNKQANEKHNDENQPVKIKRWRVVHCSTRYTYSKKNSETKPLWTGETDNLPHVSQKDDSVRSTYNQYKSPWPHY